VAQPDQLFTLKVSTGMALRQSKLLFSKNQPILLKLVFQICNYFFFGGFGLLKN
jgi:hypothetical protein